MGIFEGMLKSGESLFIDEIALDYEYLPHILPYREAEQRRIASCIQPLFQQRNGKNLFVYGSPGIGKTAASKHVLRDLELETDEIIPLYVNCWKKNSSFKIALDICDQVGIRFTVNKRTDELIEMLKQRLNKSSAVFIFDEVDKLEDMDFLYFLLEDIYRKTIVLITNYKSWLLELDERVKSRLNPELVEFREYDERETKGILAERRDFAFVKRCWDEDAFNIIAEKAFKLKDIRSGLYLMKESALAAEGRSSKRVAKQDVESAIKKFDEFSIRKSADLDDSMRNILDIIKRNDNRKIGEIFEQYQKEGGALSYKSFTRRIARLEEGKFISLEKTDGGDLGNTSIIKYKGSSAVKKLTDF